jgi:ATP-binding protein involved in chromosome partitioning
VVLELDAVGRFLTVVIIFGTGGAERLAVRHGFPVLGRVPLNPDVRVGGDGVDPIVVSAPGSPLAEIFSEIAGKAAQRIAVRAFSSLPVIM